MAIHFDLSEISRRTGITLRKLRYCLDHELISERTWTVHQNEQGKPRYLDEASAVLVAGAAVMLDGGCKRETVKYFMKYVERPLGTGRNPLHRSIIQQAVASNKPSVAQIGDERYMRWVLGDHDTGWKDPVGGFADAPDCQPLVTITLNLGRLRESVIRGAASELNTTR